MEILSPAINQNLEKEIADMMMDAHQKRNLPDHTTYFSDQEFEEITQTIQQQYGSTEIPYFLRAVDQEIFGIQTHQRLSNYLLENNKLIIPAGLENYDEVQFHPKAKYESQGLINIHLKHDEPIIGVQMAGWTKNNEYNVLYSYERDMKVVANIETRSIWDLVKIQPIK